MTCTQITGPGRTCMVLLILSLAFAGKAAFSSQLDAASLPLTGSESRKHTVTIEEFAFVPEKLEAAVGDTVVWINKDVVPHTATADDESWSLENIGQDEISGTFIIQKEGTQTYFCRYHPAMKGSISTVNSDQ